MAKKAAAKARPKRKTAAKTKSKTRSKAAPSSRVKSVPKTKVRTAPPARASQPASSMSGVRVRMYRLGVGDCFLVRFLRPGRDDFHMLIDCGVHQSQTGGPDRVREAVADIKRETGGRLDVIVATHEHMDHISGFKQAAEDFKTFKVGEIWFAWTEDDKDDVARKLADGKLKLLGLLESAQQRLRLSGLDAADHPLTGLMGFFGGGAGKQLKACGDVLKSLSEKKLYHRPGDPPIEIEGANARIFVLGPPREKPDLIGKSAPSAGAKSEVYGFAFGADAETLEPALDGRISPLFGRRYVMPMDATKGIAFFNRHYWGDFAADAPTDREDLSQSWRRIEVDWLDAATSLALKLDKDTNNTSLVLAIELGPPDADGPVLLFAADAQVGNWLSWQTVEWNDYHGRKVTGPDLLRRTCLYKVGHHASHNATLRDLGLELMDNLELALIPTDAKMAEKVKWGTLPWGPLLARLAEKSSKGVVRTDVSRANVAGVRETPLFYEVTL